MCLSLEASWNKCRVSSKAIVCIASFNVSVLPGLVHSLGEAAITAGDGQTGLQNAAVQTAVEAKARAIMPLDLRSVCEHACYKDVVDVENRFSVGGQRLQQRRHLVGRENVTEAKEKLVAVLGVEALGHVPLVARSTVRRCVITHAGETRWNLGVLHQLTEHSHIENGIIVSLDDVPTAVAVPLCPL